MPTVPEVLLVSQVAEIPQFSKVPTVLFRVVSALVLSMIPDVFLVPVVL